ncbi:MAG: DUF349 domain-containing protein [Casimicrobium sp.]
MLKSLFSSTPKWQSSNADERLTAVADLAADDPALHTLATTDADARVRIAAIGRTITVKTLSATVADADAAVSAAAAARWGVLAAGDAPTADLPLAVVAAAVRDDSSAEWKAAAARCATRDLGAWLESHAIVSAKLEAIASSIDVALLEKLHLHWRDHDKRIGKACHDRVVDLQSRDKAAQEADVLMAQMQSWAEADEVPLTKLVDTQRAWAKLTVDADHKARFEALLISLQRKMQNEAASRRLHEALAMQVAGLSLKSKKASELNTEELNALAHDATVAQSSPVLDAGLAQQLQQVHSTIAGEQQSRERNAAGEALLASIPQAPQSLKRQERERAPKKPREPKSAAAAADAAPLTQVETLPAAEAGVPAPEAVVVEPASAESVAVVTTAPEQVVAEATAVAEIPAPAEAVVAAVVEAAPGGVAETADAAIAVDTVVADSVAVTESAAAPDAPAATVAPVQSEAEIAAAEKAIADHAKAVADYETANAEWKAKWSAWLAGADAPTRERFERRLAALQKPAAAPKPERPMAARADDADLAAANDALTKLAEIIAAGDVRGSRNAATKLFQQFTAKRFPKLEEQRLNELDGEVKRLESWLKWSDGQARDGLMAKAEALKNLPQAPDVLAKEIRAIQEEWKALDKKNGGAPKPKWDKFNAVCKEAYAPAKAHFDSLRKQRNENASGREKIIESLHALADEAAAPLAEGQVRDWVDIEKRKSALFDQWKKGGGVANAAWESLDKKFDVALHKLDAGLDAAREPEIARRKRLITEAEELANATPSREVTDRAITVQRRWAAERPQGLPHLRRKDEQKLWDEFKKHTDAVFKARDTQRDQMKAQFSEATKARFAVIDEVKALANSDDPKAIDAGIGLARTQWRNLPFVDRDKARDLDRKFDDALAAAKKRAIVLSRGSVIEAMKNALAAVPATDAADKTAAALVIDAELISGIDSPAEIATARRMQQLRWLSERRQLPTAPDAKITAVRTLLGAFNATGAKITLGERERLTRAIEAVGAA